MLVLGIDFGGSRLRAMRSQDGVMASAGHPYVSERMPFLPRVSIPAEENSRITCRIISLKRTLDFDSVFPTSSADRNSVDWLAGMLGAILSKEDDMCQGKMAHCVLTAPPFFSQRQRSSLQTAGNKAGFSRVWLMDDTLAALLACRGSLHNKERVLVFSWGATGFSAVLYHSANGQLRAVAQEGNKELGGDDLDAVIAEAILALLPKVWRNFSPSESARLFPRVAIEAERAKRILATTNTLSIPLVRIIESNLPSKYHDQSIVLNRHSFESLLSHMVSDAVGSVGKRLGAEEGWKPDAILTVGGTALFPEVRNAIMEKFQKPLLHADEDAVALGAALYGQAMMDSERDEITHSSSIDQSKHVERTQALSSSESSEDSGTRSMGVQEREVQHLKKKTVYTKSTVQGDLKKPLRQKVQSWVGKKIGRNEQCPCGSGLKYKKCCGKVK